MHAAPTLARLYRAATSRTDLALRARAVPTTDDLVNSAFAWFSGAHGATSRTDLALRARAVPTTDDQVNSAFPRLLQRTQRMALGSARMLHASCSLVAAGESPLSASLSLNRRRQ